MLSAKQAEARYWLGLLRAPGVGPSAAAKLLAHYGSAEAVFAGDRQTWQHLGLKSPALDWLQQPDWDSCQVDLDWLAADNHHLLTPQHASWPSVFDELAGMPIALYAMGDIELLKWPKLAIVGSRNPTTSGRRAAFDFAEHLAAQGLGIISGLALGVDAAAHEGALAANGVTVAVCGTGLDRVYPRANHALAKQVAESGLMLSEFPIGTPVLASNFPRRNRVISALSLGTLVVEAAVRSGSLITARYANEQGREVFAMPGSIHNPLARGCHRLIRDGAKLVENAADVLEDLSAQLGAEQIVGKAPVKAQASPVATDNPLLQWLEYDPVSVDSLVSKSGLTAAQVSSMLTVLEIEGQVEKTASGAYIRL